MMEMIQAMKQEMRGYRWVSAALMVAAMALLASACKSPTDFDTPQNVDSTQVGDTVVPFASNALLVPPFTQTIAVNGFVFLHELPLGSDSPTQNISGLFVRRAGNATVTLALDLQHDPAQSYFGTGGFIPYQVAGLTVNMKDLPADSLSSETRVANESDGAATLTLAEYDLKGKVVGTRALPARAQLTLSTVMVMGSPISSTPVPMIEIQIRLTATDTADPGGNVFFYRVDGAVYIPWP